LSLKAKSLQPRTKTLSPCHADDLSTVTRIRWSMPTAKSQQLARRKEFLQSRSSDLTAVAFEACAI
jgi:hypothetical protein